MICLRGIDAVVVSKILAIYPTMENEIAGLRKQNLHIMEQNDHLTFIDSLLKGQNKYLEYKVNTLSTQNNDLKKIALDREKLIGKLRKKKRRANHRFLGAIGIIGGLLFLL